MALPRHTISREQTSASSHLLLFLFRWSKSYVVGTARADAFRSRVSVYQPPVLSAHQGRSATRHHPRLHRARVWNTKHDASEICTRKKKSHCFLCACLSACYRSRRIEQIFILLVFSWVSVTPVGKFPSFAFCLDKYRAHFMSNDTC